MQNIHEQLCALLDKEGASYRVIEHEPEGRTELIAKIRGNRIEQSIKSIVLQVKLSRRENIYCLANVPGHCRVDLDAIKDHFNADSIGIAQREKAQATPEHEGELPVPKQPPDEAEAGELREHGVDGV